MDNLSTIGVVLFGILLVVVLVIYLNLRKPKVKPKKKGPALTKPRLSVSKYVLTMKLIDGSTFTVTKTERTQHLHSPWIDFIKWYYKRTESVSFRILAKNNGSQMVQRKDIAHFRFTRELVSGRSRGWHDE